MMNEELLTIKQEIDIVLRQNNQAYNRQWSKLPGIESTTLILRIRLRLPELINSSKVEDEKEVELEGEREFAEIRNWQ